MVRGFDIGYWLMGVIIVQTIIHTPLNPSHDNYHNSINLFIHE